MIKVVNQQSFEAKASIVHNGFYDVSNVPFTRTRDYIDVPCPKHGIFNIRCSAFLAGQGCRLCRNEKVGNRFRDPPEKALLILKEKHPNLDFSQSIYITDKIKIKVLCNVHGEFNMTPGHLKKGSSCPDCARFSPKRKHTREKFIKNSKFKHGENAFDYSETDYSHSHDYVKLKCNICNGKFEQLAYSNVNIGNGCPLCKISKQEKEIHNFLENDLNLNIIKNTYKIIPPKEIDIYIPANNIAIEHNGTYYHSELNGKESVNYHKNKTEECEKLGIQLIQIFEDEWRNKQNICKSILVNKLHKCTNKIFARKCHIKEVEIKEKNMFLNTNHLQGEDQSKIKLGLYYNDELVSLMTFGRPRYNRKFEWELIRFCNKLNIVIIGGASKLWSHFIKKYNPLSIISYADRRWSNGDLYLKLGLTHNHNSLPRYWYINRKNYLQRFHRSNFTKERIKKQFSDIDLTKTEWQIMQGLNYDRIWDCGNMVFFWHKKTVPD